jgi:hypothetical protein
MDLKKPDAIANRVSLSDVAEAIKNPLAVLPAPVRPAALRLWLANKHLVGFESALPISVVISHWIDRHKLRESDAEQILDAMMSPGKMQGFKFASDLTTAIAAAVEAVLKRRDAEERDALLRAPLPEEFRSPPDTRTPAEREADAAKAEAAIRKARGLGDPPPADNAANAKRNEDFARRARENKIE